MQPWIGQRLLGIRCIEPRSSSSPPIPPSNTNAVPRGSWLWLFSLFTCDLLTCWLLSCVPDSAVFRQLAAASAVLRRATAVTERPPTRKALCSSPYTRLQSVGARWQWLRPAPHSDIDTLHAAPCPCIARIDTAPRIAHDRCADTCPPRHASTPHAPYIPTRTARASSTALAAFVLATNTGLSAGRLCQHRDTRPRRFLATTSETCPLQQPGDDSAKA